MTEFLPRRFCNDAEIERIGERVLARTLPSPEWTHKAHLAATAYLCSGAPLLTSMRICRGSSAATMRVSAE